MTDWNQINNTLSQALLQGNRLEDFLSNLGCDLRHFSYRGKSRIPCPVHEGDGPNMQIDTGGYVLPIRWSRFTQRCHNKWKSSLLGLVRGILSTQEGRDVGMRSALDCIRDYVGVIPDAAPVRPRPAPEPRLLSWDREEVRRRLVIPSPYFLDRGFSREVLDAFDVGYSPKLDREVVPLYDETGRTCIGYEARSNKTHGEPKWRGMSGFPKHRHLYNLARAKATESPFVFLVEGAPDVLRLAEAGYVGVALLGSDASEVQLAMLGDLGKQIYVALDNDAAGRAACERLLGRASFPAIPFWVPESYKDVGETPADALRELVEDRLS